MPVKGCYYFIDQFIDLKNFEQHLSSYDDISTGFYIIITGQIKIKDGRSFGHKDKESYAVTLLFLKNDTFNIWLESSSAVSENIVSVNDIDVIEWNTQDRLLKGIYFENYLQLINFLEEKQEN